MFASQLPQALSPDDYLRLERRAEVKNEFIGGEMVAMSGASLSHNLISGNLFATVHGQLRGRTCRVFGSDLRVRAGDDYFYPDLSVACPGPEVEGPGGDNLTNPTVLCEVLSPSTERRDRTVKSAAYRRLPSLMAYLLIDQDRPYVECLRRRGPFWVYESYDRLDDSIDLEVIGCRLSLSELYAGVPLASGEA